MGAGASKTDAPVKRELRTGTEHKDEAEQIAKRPTKDDVKFIELCQQIFALADKDQDAKLDYNEFWEAFSSKTLNLNLSDEEMSELRDMSDTNGDGKIDFEEFKALVANLKDYIKLVYEKVASGANDWCCLKDADTGQMMFLNKRTGKTQKSKPKHFKDERVDELKFDHITLDDGTVISTYKDEEGKNMYMDWEAGTWVPLPEEWSRMLDATEDIIPDVQNAVVNATDDDQTEEVDPRLGTFKHPTKGTYSTYIFSNERNTRLFFDDDEGAWVRMPLSWERNVEDVQAMLQEVHAAPRTGGMSTSSFWCSVTATTMCRMLLRLAKSITGLAPKRWTRRNEGNPSAALPTVWSGGSLSTKVARAQQWWTLRRWKETLGICRLPLLQRLITWSLITSR